MPSLNRIFAFRLFASDVRLISLDVEGKKPAIAPAQHNQFRLLVSHLLDRFFNNEMVSTDGEALPLIMTVACAIAVPTLIAAIFVFPAYHAFPPHPRRPTFWSQAIEHYFFGLYSLVAMGCVTVFEADLLFPDRLDILILSTLPIASRRLVLARVLAVLIFLVLFLLGINVLGTFAYPLSTEWHVRKLIVAHFASVTAAGIFSAASFVALQGILICTLSGRIYRAACTLLQAISMAVLLGLLFLFAALSQSLEALLGDPAAAQYFPPFWFLGIYESLLAGPSGLPIFARLAHTGLRATSIALFVAIATYPLAYRHRTRQAIEGSASRYTQTRLTRPFTSLLHATLLRTPSRRAVFHFIAQTLRTQSHRVYLAIYAGLGVALMTAFAVVFTVDSGHVHLALSPYRLRLAIPGVAFWAIAGLCTALDSPADPAASWAFRIIDPKPTSDQLEAVRIWVATWGTCITLAAVALLHSIAPVALRDWRETLGQTLVGAGLCILLTDVFLLYLKAVPFTETRIPRNTDLAFVLLRYIIVFPSIVLVTVRAEPWIEAAPAHLLLTALALFAVHRALRYTHYRIVANRLIRPDLDETHGMIHTLALRD